MAEYGNTQLECQYLGVWGRRIMSMMPTLVCIVWEASLGYKNKIFSLNKKVKPGGGGPRL